MRAGVVKETIVIIGSDVYEKLTDKEKKEFHFTERYKRLYELEYLDCNSETNEETEVTWEGDCCFDDMEELLKFGGVEEMEDWDILDVSTCCYKVFDDEEDKEYFEDLAKKAGVQGKQVKIKKANQGWYKENIYDADYTGEE